MQFRKALVFGLALASSSLFTIGAHANLVSNGSFETGIASNPYQTLNASSMFLTDWTISNGSIDLIRSYWQPKDGQQSVDMSGNGPGIISQTLNTVPTQTYKVSFWMAGNPDDADKTKTLEVMIGPPTQQNTYTFDATGKSASNMGWVEKTFQFTASSNSSVISFASVPNFPGDPYGPALDNVSVTAIPEVSTMLSFGSLLGVSGLGLLRSRRVRKSA